MLSESSEKILIIDEDRSFADALAARLIAMGMETRLVYDPLEGIDLLREGLYGIVIVDPEKNFSVIEEVSANILRVVILAIVKSDDIGASAHALKAGVVDLLPEKMEPGQLESIIRRALDRRSLMEQTMRLRKKIVGLCILAGVCFLLGFLLFYLS
jgi:DNA-binding NtrC family response regulator